MPKSVYVPCSEGATQGLGSPQLTRTPSPSEHLERWAVSVIVRKRVVSIAKAGWAEGRETHPLSKIRKE